MRDEHCHILWDVDDGSQSLEMTRSMLDGVRACGFTEVVCTPHMRWKDFDAAKVRAVDWPPEALLIESGGTMFDSTKLEKLGWKARHVL